MGKFLNITIKQLLHSVPIDLKINLINQRTILVNKYRSCSHVDSSTMRKRHYHNYYWPVPYKLRQEKLLNSSSRLMYFNEYLWIFQTFYSEKYIPVHQYIMCNASWIIHNLDGRERKQLLQRDKSFQTIVLNNFLKKKSFQLICPDKIFKTVCGILF